MILFYLPNNNFGRPFTFDSNDKFEEERHRAHINKISELKVYGLDLMRENNLIRSEERFDGLCPQGYDDDSGHNYHSFVSDDSKKIKSRKNNQSEEVFRQLLEESDFQEKANSDSDRSEYMFKTIKKLGVPSSSVASSKKLLSTLSAKILKVSEVKKNAKGVDNIFSEKVDNITNEENANTSSLSTTLEGIPKLLDLHSARLKQGLIIIFCYIVAYISNAVLSLNQTTLSQTLIVIARDRKTNLDV